MLELSASIILSWCKRIRENQAPLLSNRNNTRKSYLSRASTEFHFLYAALSGTGNADQDWSFASSLLIRHHEQLANKSHREGKPAFSFLAVARKELATAKHNTRRHRQIIRTLGDSAPAEKDIVAFIKKEQMRCFAWGMEKGWPTPEEKPVDAPRQPARNAEVQAAQRHRS